MPIHNNLHLNSFVNPYSNSYTALVLISQGGLRPITTDIIDRIKDASENVNIIRPRDVTQVINKAVQETKSSLGEDEATYGKTYGAALLIAFYAKGKPYIYTCNIFDTGVSEPAESHFTTIGIADPLANYLFCELSKRGDDDALQLAAMIYMILKVKENNAFCGGPTRIKLLKTFPDEMHTTGGRATEVDASFIKRAEEVLILRDQQSREERNRQMIAILREVASGFFKT